MTRVFGYTLDPESGAPMARQSVRAYLHPTTRSVLQGPVVAGADEAVSDTDARWELNLLPTAGSGRCIRLFCSGLIDAYIDIPTATPGGAGDTTAIDVSTLLVDPKTLDPVVVSPSVYLPRAERGAPDGVASLGSDGKVPTGQLPASSGGVSLGETSTTAYRGDRGKTAYDHSQVTSGNPHGVTKTDVGLAAVSNLAPADMPVSTAQQTALGLKANTSSLAPVATSGAYTDLTGRPTIPAAFADLSGQASDAQIPSGIARDSEVAATLALAEVYPLTGYGFHSATFHPDAINEGSTYSSWHVRMWVPAGQPINTVAMHITNAAVLGAGGLNGFAIYGDDGQTKLGETVSADSLWTSTGMRSAAMASGIAAETAGRFVRVLANVAGMSAPPSTFYIRSTPAQIVDPLRTAFLSAALTSWPATFDPATTGTRTEFLPLIYLG